jgi:natural product biosynthesis luciferase-like monooxygenase protein
MDRVIEAYPLSHVQEGMLFHHLEGRRGVYLEQIVGVLMEDVDPAAFEEGWRRVQARHAQLRVGFRWEGLPQPVQDVHEEVPFPFHFEDWRGEASPEDRLRSFLRRDRKEGFDLRRPPLMRVSLFRLADAEYRFVWTFPHLLLDGRSFPRVIEEAFAFCQALRDGEQLVLPPPPPYRRYVEWLRDRDASADEAFWRQALAGLSGPTSIGLRQPSAAPDEGEESGERELRLPRESTSALREWAGRHGLTLGTLVQGAWALLLARYGDEDEVVFGITRAGRRALSNADEMVGVLINTLPARTRVDAAAPLVPWLRDLRGRLRAMAAHEHAPLVKLQGWSQVPAGTPLFESILVYDSESLEAALRRKGGAWQGRRFQLLERTSYALTLYAYGDPELWLKVSYERRRFEDAAVSRMLGHLCTLLESMPHGSEARLGELPLLTEPERRLLLVERNDTRRDCPAPATLHGQFEAQAQRTPGAVAVIFEDQSLTYAELDARANRLARHLQGLGVTHETLVGVSMERSLEMMVALLGVLKAGGAYVPLDPRYPRERLSFMLQDAQVSVLLTQGRLAEGLPAPARVVRLDSDWEQIARNSEGPVSSAASGSSLAYVIYTSGSTGKPKGVMVEHGSVVNFFSGLDERLQADAGGVWLAVTSLSFDISVLELFWTLARGFKVVIQREADRVATPSPSRPRRGMEFSLFYFASDEGERSSDKYRLLLEGARFADRNGFSAIWTPERHFHAFGGLYPNPAVAGAALAVITQRLQIRAGSVVLPLHNPLRVAEEWALVDNLSGGRVGVSFASGWQPNDFVLAPENYAERKELMFRWIDRVRRLWRGEAVALPGPSGTPVEVRTLPRPVQHELPVWVTSAGSAETYRMAGEIGANVLTHLLGQSVAELAEKLAAYRRAWKENGFPGAGHVTLMLHTFVGDSDEEVREKVRGPMTAYLRTSMGLIKDVASSFPVFRNAPPGEDFDEAFRRLPPGDMQALLDHAFARYFETSGLLGSSSTCLRMVERLQDIGVDEVACLIDFGVASDEVLAHLEHLDRVRREANRAASARDDYSLPAQAARHGVTHLQCTPSMASLLVTDEGSHATLRRLRKLLVGGEALPGPLAAELRRLVPGEVINMYGPTETTIWSSTHRLDGGDGAAAATVPIGRPIANTEFYVVDRGGRLVPEGVAGELLIGGPGVARGYLNRPDLTRDRFVADTFGARPGGRLYRTGDLVRYRSDGALEYLGRTDQQVKIRGHRVELGEIESLLRGHPGVRETVVVAREDAPGDHRLVAYLVPEEGALPTSEGLRRHLRDQLPEHMVPSAFVLIGALPLTPNGKVDRRALPAPQSARSESAGPFVSPQSELERAIAAIWQDVLGVSRVSTQDNFFDLGGHSLLAVQVHSRLRQVMDREVSLTDLFRFPSIRVLAAHLSQASAPADGVQQGAERAEARKEAMARRRQLQDRRRGRPA